VLVLSILVVVTSTARAQTPPIHPGVPPQEVRPTAAQPAEWWLVILTGGLVAATVLLVFPGLYQAFIARSAARQQLRAYVGFEEGSINSTNLALPPAAQIKITNSGATPAFDVFHRVRMAVGAFPGPPALADQTRAATDGKSVLFPRVSTSTRADLDHVLTAVELAELTAHTAAIYVYGEVTYRDAFRRQRRTYYRLMTFTTGTFGNLYFCNDGNNAD